MNRYVKSLFFITMLVFGLTSTSRAAVMNGEMAPDFTLEDTEGNSHSLSDFQDKYVVLEWLNHDCPFVRKHYDSGNMQNLQKTYTQEGVIWLSISSSAHGKQGHYHPEDADQLTAQKGASPTAVLLDFDGVVGHLYGAKTTPHMFIIAPGGKLLYQGAIDDIPSTDPDDVARAQNYVQAALDAAMSGQPIAVTANKSYGCSVKY